MGWSVVARYWGFRRFAEELRRTGWQVGEAMVAIEAELKALACHPERIHAALSRRAVGEPNWEVEIISE